MCAGLVAVVVVGCAGAPVPSQTPDPTLPEGVSTPASPRATPRGTIPAAATSRPLPNDTPIAPGEYTYGLIPGLRMTFTVAADGWESWGDGVVKGLTEPTRMAGFGFGEIASVHADPCRWQNGRIEPPLGPTVDDLAAALVALPHFDLRTSPETGTVDGFAGTYLKIQIADDVVIDDCDEQAFNTYIWTDGTARYHQGPGQIEEFWILDVDGKRLLINAASFPGTDPDHLAERDAIMDTLTIERLD